MTTAQYGSQSDAMAEAAAGRWPLLASIRGPQDVKGLDAAQLEELCRQIREALVAFGKRHGGHIGSNLGLVEATVALHRVFDSPHDRIVFDVSHQSYVHKMLTGRAAAFLDPERFGDVTGFTNPQESGHDQFVLGHTGTSISLATGLARQRDMERAAGKACETGNVIAVIGDGALSSAVAFEGLNNAAEQGGNLIIVFNDNEMSIAENHGGMYATLARMRESGGTAEPNLFEAFGLDYRYVEAGNDVAALVEALDDVKDIDHPIVLHIHTRKGLGMDADADDVAAGYREGRCEANHWQDPLQDASMPATPAAPAVQAMRDAAGELRGADALGAPDVPAPHPHGARKYYGQLAMDALSRRFGDEPGLVVISPATPGSNGITRAFRRQAGSHYVDTGITEEHAVAYASGIARAGGRPVVATSATFFQRAFDQIQQELSLNATPVTLLSFGGGLSDADNTHSGAFDIAMFGNIPGLTCLAPTNGRMFLRMLEWSTSLANTKPVLIRVPGQMTLDAERSGELKPSAQVAAAVDARLTDRPEPFARYAVKQHGSRVAILGLSDASVIAGRVVRALEEGDAQGACATDGMADEAVHATWIDPLQFSAIDEATLRRLPATHQVVVTIEDGQLEGGWGEKVTAFYANEMPDAGVKTFNFGARKEFTDRVGLAHLLDRYAMTVPGIVSAIRQALG